MSEDIRHLHSTPEVLPVTASKRHQPHGRVHLEEYIDEQIADQGWHEALAEFRITQGIGEDVLDWNYDALLAQAREMFDLVPLDGWWHLFTK